MKTRSLFLTIAAGLIVSGIGALDARAGNVPLPTALDPGLTTTTTSTPGLVIATSNGNTTTVNGMVFSNFNYNSTGTGTATAYPATAVGVLGFSNGPNTGIEFAGGFSVASSPTSSGVQDLAITYTVTAKPGTMITDADLVISGITTGTGVATVSETLTNAVTGKVIGSLLVSAGGVQSQEINFAGVTSINVLKDIDLNSGTAGSASISIVGQGFSTNSSTPEPTSIALLGIGMTGFLAFRRLFKRNSVA